MTTTAIRREFEKLASADQAQLLKDLASSLAESLSYEDRKDRRVFRKRRREETSARSWTDVQSRLTSSRSRRK